MSKVEYFYVLLAVLAVGGIDHVTGSDIHVVSLYFIPLAFAGWRLGHTGAVIASLLSTGAWLAALYTTGTRYSEAYIWVANFVTEGIAFLTVSLLVAVLAEALRREQSRSHTDSLTGLMNRLAFVEQAASALSLCRRHARPVSLAYIDLDNFKNVNDLLGHTRGDELLQKCGHVISESLRASDLAARLGGDEFVIFLPETGSENARVLLDRLRVRLNLSHELQFAGVTASIGIVADDRATSSIDELVKRADAEMYKVKRAGKNQVAIQHLSENVAQPF